MGKEKYLKEIEELFKKSGVVDSSSIIRIMNNKKKIKQYNKQLIRNLILKNKIKRLAKGCYTIEDDPSLAVFCFKPAYLGLQDALSFHNLWEQETIPIIITAKKARTGIRKVLGMNILIRKIDKKYLFGLDYYQQGRFYFPYSDIEKTLIDLIYFRQNLNKETLNNIKKIINKKKLLSYLKIYPERFRNKVLNTIKETK